MTGTAAPLGWRQRLSPARFLRGLGPEEGPVTLDRSRIFILPTRQGLAYVLVLSAILVGAVNYENSLAYALVFTLVGLGVVSILHTYRNLQGLLIRAGRPTPVFAGDRAQFPIGIVNPTRRTRYAVTLSLPAGAGNSVDVVAGETWIELSQAAPVRGRLFLGRFIVATRFPLGLLRAWSHIDLGMQCLVYPTPALLRGLPPTLPGSGGNDGAHGFGHEEFAALRPYRVGDLLSHVHWKAVAREQGMQIKQFSGEAQQELWLAWELLPGTAPELRLQRLCRWVLEADGAGLTYGLALPGRRIEPAIGAAHRRVCLEALALFGETR